jgi:hypothetical protein
MKITIATFGSRGDIQPQLALVHRYPATGAEEAGNAGIHKRF